MENDEQKVINKIDEAVANVSQVTPKKRISFLNTPAFHVGVGLALLFLVMGYFRGHAAEKEDNKAQSANYQRKSSTLKQNLQAIKVLKEKEEQAKKQAEILRMQAFIASQKKKHENSPSSQPVIKYVSSEKSNKNGVSEQMLKRINAPSNFINVEYTGPSGRKITNTSTVGKVLSDEGPMSTFVNQNSSIGYVKASKMAHPEYTIAAGEVIEATLETAIDSQLPGTVRAVVSRDVYSLDGSHLLIPKGAHAVGQYASSMIGQTQTRVLAIWNRVQMSDGTFVTINSQSGDKLGRAGQEADYINRHFMAKFGTSLMFSVLGAYAANTGVNGLDGFNSASQYRMGIAQSLQKTSSEVLSQTVNIAPTIKIHQGKKIAIKVARDLDFYRIANKGDDYGRTK